MLKNYIRIAWRNLSRNKVFSTINIAGLAIGIAAALLILQYVSFELSYDRFHQNADRIFRIKQDRYNDGKLSTEWAAGNYAVGNSFKDHLPEIADYVKVIGFRPLLLGYGDKSLKISRAFYASEAFFRVFSYPLLSGDVSTILKEPGTVALSASTARSLFGNEDPVGKTITQDNKHAFKVTGVYNDMQANTHLHPEILFSYATFQQAVKPDDPETAWSWDGCLTYLLLQPGVNPHALEAKFPALVKRLAGESQDGSQVAFTLQPLKDIHLYSHFMLEAEANGDGQTVYLLIGIAVFIIVIAWINYINLATARSVNRAVEVGVRKAVGSLRSQLIFQFMTESVLLNGMAVGAALLLVLISAPLFSSLSGQQLSFALLRSATFWVVLGILFLAGSFLSGLYPAFVLSGFKPVVVLKGKAISSRQGGTLRKSLVVVQFAASIFLLAGMLTVFRQISYMRSQSLGINITQTLVINPPITGRGDSTFVKRMAAFKEHLVQESAIRGVSVSSVIPGDRSPMNAGGIRLWGADPKNGRQYRVLDVDYDFVKTYELKLIAGRNFSKDFGADGNAVIFNKTGIKELGFANPQDAIGKEIDFWGRKLRIEGVVEDYHQQSLKEAFEPLLLRLDAGAMGYFSVKMSPSEARQTISVIQRNWETFFPGNPFEYFFLDEHFDEQYRADQRFGSVFGLFTTLAVLVACLGLFGLASFTILQRTKEISIRKILGASVTGIVVLLYKEFAMLVLLAFVVAAPLAWYSAAQWLQGYAFHTVITWWQFALPFVLVLLIAFITVSFQSIKAALMNPVTSLRSE
ncbi:MAG TPA: ABC transporter permease [Chitinophaga sp.]|uniref:ABC transporter permease n=1 Tax=Chitinophaga sp. TaxID=1869181 RepID=UPI002BFE49A3|nr:ABC transporter permease [Chitinophaga sp.]HVI47741.1 ABC transporter permease [Chitinophaga sp.]